MKRREHISAIMTRDVLTIDVNQSLHEVNEILAKNHIRHLPVVSGEELVGIISQTDILRISFGNTFGAGQEDADEAIFDMLSINQVMKHEPMIIGQNQTIREAAQIFTEQEFHALPVLDGDKIVGIVTTTDIIKYFLEAY
ncbi:MAG: CBS domain-containing protein [Reichenbachiella sp.]|uniref:CBS domain-containing protein n=2 Tax=Reichenbachiella sp. TaxID=2184521 RepID=UPI00326684DA